MKLQHPRYRLAIKTSLVIFFAYLIVFGGGLFFTVSAVHSLKTFQLEKAANQTKTALYFVRPLRIMSLGLPDITLWQTALETVDLAAKCAHLGQTYINQSLSSDKSPTVPDDTFSQCPSSLKQKTVTLKSQGDQSFFIQRFPAWKKMQTTWPVISQTLTTIETLFSGKHTIVILLQNSQELRATGGFMGSFVEIDLDQGSITSLEVFDIYEPDGQFEGYMEAPPGVTEYLSGGQGLRLPDSNWHPDFPSSAQQILRFFALAERQNIDTVMAVNLSLAEEMLRITGDIEVPDYDRVVTPKNLAEVARADREQFFPGSYQKVNFLSSLLTQLKIKLQQLDHQKQTALLKLFFTKVTTKEWMAYSTNAQVQSFFEEVGISGKISYEESKLPFYLVESNVGINKANKQIQRGVFFSYSPYRITVTIEFINSNDPKSDLHYANYQRIITAPEVAISQISIGDQILETWDEDLITNSDGQQFKQIGFLVELPLSQTKNVTIDLVPEKISAFPSTITFFKQPGLPLTPYTITIDNQSNQFLLEHDLTIDTQDIINT